MGKQKLDKLIVEFIGTNNYLINRIEVGDLVDFGDFGQFYITAIRDGNVKCTTNEDDRYDKYADGRVLPVSLAQEIVSKGYYDGNDEEPEEYFFER